jgi:5,5'-dehydrodivanillate O-demethylase oxygenase subunit
MISKEENESMTRVGAGTPAGELLRRYWHPVAAACELSEAGPIKRVRILGEDLVLFQLRQAHGGAPIGYGLVEEQCAHRLASLYHGRVDAEGIRCPYHGWKFGPSGRCLEQPAEPEGSTYKERITQKAYPVRKLGGLLFAYLGPLPVPLLPRWDVLAREDGRRWGVIESVINCNWLQPMENSVDPAHLYWLHGGFGADKDKADEARFAALGVRSQYQEKHDFVRFEYGIQKVRVTGGKNPGDPPQTEQHPLVFPTILRLVLGLDVVRAQGYDVVKTFTEADTWLKYMHNMQFRMPIDDTHTRVFHVNFMPSRQTVTSPDADVPFEHCSLKDQEGGYDFQIVTAQDAMAWETQGGLTDRSREHLGVSDRGIAILRRLLKEQINIVREGGDPMGVIRDPDKNRLLDLNVFHEPFGLPRPASLPVLEAVV